MDPNSERASDTKDIRHGLLISRRQRNWLKKRYGSITKGMYAVLDFAMAQDEPPPPVYDPRPVRARTTPFRRPQREVAPSSGKKALDLSAAIEALQNQGHHPQAQEDDDGD